MPRCQNAHAIVHAGFLYEFDHENRVLGCRIAYGGLSANFTRALKTERYVTGRKLFDNDTLQGALHMLNEEMVVLEDDPPEMSTEYRRRLALGLLYKVLLVVSFGCLGIMYYSNIARQIEDIMVSLS